MTSFEQIFAQQQAQERIRQELISSLKEDIRRRLGSRFDSQLDPKAEPPFNGLKIDELGMDLVVQIASLMSELTNAGLNRNLELLREEFESRMNVQDGKLVLNESEVSLDLAPNTHMGLQIDEFGDLGTVAGEVYAWMSSNVPSGMKLGRDIARPLAEAGIPLSSSLRSALFEAKEKA